MDCIIDDEECIESFKEDLDGDGPPLLEEGEAEALLSEVEDVKNWRRGEDRGDDDFMMISALIYAERWGRCEIDVGTSLVSTFTWERALYPSSDDPPQLQPPRPLCALSN